MTFDRPRPVDTTAPASFAAVAEELLDDVYGYLLYLTKNWAVAEDLTSETFEAALAKWRRFDPGRGTARDAPGAPVTIAAAAPALRRGGRPLRPARRPAAAGPDAR